MQLQAIRQEVVRQERNRVGRQTCVKTRSVCSLENPKSERLKTRKQLLHFVAPAVRRGLSSSRKKMVCALRRSPALHDTLADTLPSQAQVKTDRYAFLVEWVDPVARITWKYELLYYMKDQSIEMVRSRIRPAQLRFAQATVAGLTFNHRGRWT